MIIRMIEAKKRGGTVFGPRTRDYGIGFDLKIANITGSLVIVGSFILTILIYH